MNARPRRPQPLLQLVEQGPGSPEPAPRGRIVVPVAFGALALAAVAVTVAYWVPDAPKSLLGRAAAFFLVLLLILAAVISAFTRYVDKNLGAVSPTGASARIVRGKYVFDLALIVALAGLGAIAGLAWMTADARLDLFVRAWLLLLIVGCTAGLAASLFANFLNLIEPREM